MTDRTDSRAGVRRGRAARETEVCARERMRRRTRRGSPGRSHDGRRRAFGVGRPPSVRRAVACTIVVVLGLLPHGLHAQEERLTAACAATGAADDALRFCNLVAQAIETVQPRIGLAATGGNPVPGTASTLGMRVGTLPRFSVAGRATGVWADSPPILSTGGGNEIDFLLTSYNAHAAVGVFQGFSPAPTVGGVASLDLLGAIGLLPLPSGDGFADDTPFTWALGARLGALRESFTLPGVSITGSYRSVGDAVFGDPSLDATDGFYALDGIGIWSLRGAVSKQLFALGLTAGVGYDHYSSDVQFGFANPSGTGPSEPTVAVDDFENDRFNAFANVSWTLLIVHFVGELGWQSGTDEVDALLPPTAEVDEGGAFFGSLAIRISI